MRLFETDFSELYDRNNRVVAIAQQFCDLYGLIEYQKFHYYYQQIYSNDDVLYDFKIIIELEAQLNQPFICEFSYFYDHRLKGILDSFLVIRKSVETIDYYPYEQFNNPLDLQDQKIVQFLKKSFKKLTEQQKETVLVTTLNHLNKGYPIESVKTHLNTSHPSLLPKELDKFLVRLEKKQDDLRLWTLKGHKRKELFLR
jgi:succinate dehydrogenase flavin-adding protein (antitoxin of CptAB toxin-antitoxin module)